MSKAEGAAQRVDQINKRGKNRWRSANRNRGEEDNKR